MPNESALNIDPHRSHAPWPGFAGQTDAPKWHVLWTRSNCEQRVNDQLLARGFETFLPKLECWSRRRDRRCQINAPMFPGYLFLRHAMDKESYLEVCRCRGLVQILGERWDRLGTVPDEEIESIRKVLDADMPAAAHPYLKAGQRVRITEGPLAGTEGILVKLDADRGRLVLSIDLLKRSVAVEIECAAVVPV